MDGQALSKSFELLSRYCPADVNGNLSWFPISTLSKIENLHSLSNVICVHNVCFTFRDLALAESVIFFFLAWCSLAKLW